jgi:hypothetical protein
MTLLSFDSFFKMLGHPFRMDNHANSRRVSLRELRWDKPTRVEDILRPFQMKKGAVDIFRTSGKLLIWMDLLQLINA